MTAPRSSPRFSVDCIVCGREANRKCIRQASICFSVAASVTHLHNFFSRKLCSVMRVSVTVSSLVQHILDVIGIAAKKEVLHVDTFRVVAPMANLHVSWNLSVGQFIRYPMCASRTAVNTDLSVATTRRQGCRPFDTTRLRQLGFLGKPCRHIIGGFSPATDRAVFREFPMTSSKRLPTDKTSNSHWGYLAHTYDYSTSSSFVYLGRP